jgi:heat-inducible transcriptional repressor
MVESLMVPGKKSSRESTINERAQHFLKVLIERYIQDGEPVGSRTLARDSGLELSPATIRNVMSDLEDMGLIHSPHTSAGRVPTVSGYRMFVDSLITLKPLEAASIKQLRSGLISDSDPKMLVESASQLLSGLTHMAGVVMIPRRNQVVFRQIEFLPLSGKRVLTILVTREGEVHNRVIETKKSYTPSELEQAANLLNNHYTGRCIEDMHRRLVKEMEETKDSMNRIMANALEMAEKVLEPNESGDYVMAGQTNLMDFNDLAQMNLLRKLFDSFTEKHELLQLLDASMKANGVQIFIGEESGYQNLDHCSLVTAPYEVDERIAGVLGVVGPTRMAYDRVIPIVDITAKLLGAALKPR